MLGYAVLTPARDEVDNLPRLAAALVAQTVQPLRWLVVDNGSTDGTRELLQALGIALDWLRVVDTTGERAPRREAAIARALVAGLDALDVRPDLLVKVDADIDFDADYFERLIERFEDDPSLAIASGSALELIDGEWQQRFGTGSTVWGATRTWRLDVLERLLPLDERVGWDGVDVLRANLLGLRTTTFLDLHFRHHRREGERDGTVAAFLAEGRLAHYLRYRPAYLFSRALFQGLRRPAGFAIAAGYLQAWASREHRLDDPEVTAHLRSQQKLRHLRARLREARGR
jgi:glycosyltransferase involved in cell wall biosynthesis